jgi:hypothetical protein
MGDDNKKHPCRDCVYCQWCGDDRCRLCLQRKCSKHKKLSMQEQIDLYESLNNQDRKDTDSEE